ncbi:MAG: winged helix-turn-helix transcriptional regulator [Jatrophihabitans sp.]|uniref:winged helix-turn-helix transcriptional regulator n=1 Tax=Jatrophihabitans sp. TaxID=1932789 RepID=UPI003F7DB57B
MITGRTGVTAPDDVRVEADEPCSRVVERCDAALSSAFSVLGKRWNGIVIGTLASGTAGFAELRRAIPGITDSMLSDRLTELAAAGLIERTVVTDTRPPGVSYALTDAGRALQPILDQLADWATAHLTAR